MVRLKRTTRRLLAVSGRRDVNIYDRAVYARHLRAIRNGPGIPSGKENLRRHKLSLAPSGYGKRFRRNLKSVRKDHETAVHAIAHGRTQSHFGNRSVTGTLPR